MKKMGRPTKAEMALRAKEKVELEILRRTGGRLKKATKVFDPSENYVRKRRGGNSTDKDEQPKDSLTNKNAKETETNPVQEPYLKLQALDELLSLNADEENIDSDLSKSKNISHKLQDEASEILGENAKIKESDTEFTLDIKKAQKRRRRRKRSVRNSLLHNKDSKDSDPEFVPDRVPKKLKLRKQKIKNLDTETKKIINLEDNNSSKDMTPIFSDGTILQKPQRGRPSKRSNTDFTPICSICFQANITELITCLDCNTKAHIDCLKTNFINKKLLERNWHCDNCKICEICYETYEIGNKGNIITCSVCIESYHSLCHVPAITDENLHFDQANWVCTRCANKFTQKSKKSSNTSLPKNDTNQGTTLIKVVPLNTLVKAKEIDLDKPIISEIDNINTVESKTILDFTKLEDIQSETNLLSPNIKKIEQNNKKIEDIVESEDIIPDVSNWSCERLSQFIAEIFPNEAHVFVEHEIDGASLLLMTRSSVLTKLGLRLGPALRLYNFIITLQTRKNDEFATWFY